LVYEHFLKYLLRILGKIRIFNVFKYAYNSNS